MSTRSPEAEAGREILDLVREQVDLGPRVPGSPPHKALVRTLEQRLREHTSRVLLQEFTVPLRGRDVPCTNVIGTFKAAAEPAAGPPILLGTHFDTRPRADRESDPTRRECAIPGANDGGSGTAVLLHMLPWLARESFRRDVIVAFFDAEDLGNIDGHEFSIGAEHCACHPPGEAPSEVIVLDMVGGVGMIFDIDAHILTNPGSKRLTLDFFKMGASMGWAPFTTDKPERLKYVIADHHPFARRGIATCLLIDLDYPQWHTQADGLAALSAESLGISEAAVSLFLSRHRA